MEDLMRALGRIEGKVDMLVGGLERIHERVDAIEERQAETEGRLAMLVGKLVGAAAVVSIIVTLVVDYWTR